MGGLLFCTLVAAQAQTRLNICEDVSEWAPFAFVDPEYRGEAETPPLIGFGIDVLHAMDLPFDEVRVQALPWLRCLAELEIGAQFQLSLSASIKPGRTKHFLFSRPYYTTRLHYFYRVDRNPGLADVDAASELERYRICGIHGHAYEGLPIDPSRINQGVRTVTDLFRLLELGRCDVVLSQIEIVRGHVRTGQGDLLSGRVAHAPVPGVPAERYHMLISRRWPQGEALRADIDAALERLQQNGELARIRARWDLPNESLSEVRAR